MAKQRGDTDNERNKRLQDQLVEDSNKALSEAFKTFNKIYRSQDVKEKAT